MTTRDQLIEAAARALHPEVFEDTYQPPTHPDFTGNLKGAQESVRDYVRAQAAAVLDAILPLLANTPSDALYAPQAAERPTP